MTGADRADEVMLDTTDMGGWIGLPRTGRRLVGTCWNGSGTDAIIHDTSNSKPSIKAVRCDPTVAIIAVARPARWVSCFSDRLAQ
jgi:hypothetical protein